MTNFKQNLFRTLACLSTGGLLAVTRSLHPIWEAAWLAPVPILVVALLSRRWAGFGWAVLAGVIGSIPFALYLASAAPLLTVIFVMATLALGLGAGVALSVAAQRRIPLPLAVFVFPAWSAGLDTVIAHVSPHGTAGSIAYSQMDFTPVLQVAALGGTSAVVFVVSLFASALAFALTQWQTPRHAIAAGAPAAIIVFLSLALGAWRIQAAASEPSVTVALAALNQRSQLPTDWRATFTTYRTRLEEARKRGARVLVLPEEISQIAPGDVPDMRASLSSYARASGVILAVGFRMLGPSGERNRLYVFIPDGTILDYDKRHLIPGYEAPVVVPGREPALMTTFRGLKLGGSICKDFDFADTSRQLSSAELVVAPAWDFGEDGRLHGRMAMLRAVEGGFTLLRSARRGEMTVSDRFGRVLAEAPSGSEAPLLVTQAPMPQVSPPLFARVGDVFGWACAVFSLLVGGAGLMRRQKA